MALNEGEIEKEERKIKTGGYRLTTRLRYLLN